MNEENVIEAEVVEEIPASELTPQQEFVKSLRDMADFYEARPDMELPCEACFNIFAQPAEVGKFARLLGKAQKDVLTDAYFILRRRFGQLVKLEVNWTRENVCRRVVVGQKTVKEKVPIAFEEKEVVRDIVQWECPTAVSRIAPRQAQIEE